MKRRSRSVWIGLAALLLNACAAATQAPPGAPKPASSEKVSGYAEYRQGDLLIVDGQRIAVTATTKLRGKVATFGAIPLGFEVEAKATRTRDGILVATEVEAKANGQGLFESDIRSVTDQMEAKWLRAGAVTEEDEEGASRVVGRIVSSGPAVDRVRRVVQRVTPPYVDPARLRVHVVETKDWNAMAMGNGAIWVFTGLLGDMDDDEVAIIVGHELAHYTHEHSRREFKRAMWAQLIAIGAIGAAELTTDDDRKKVAVAVLALGSSLVLRNGYSRNLEDQADRVGLRYAYQGGYDVRKGPKLWVRFRDKYGQQNGIANFFLGEHSQASARIRNLEREIAINYAAVPRGR